MAVGYDYASSSAPHHDIAVITMPSSWSYGTLTTLRAGSLGTTSTSTVRAFGFGTNSQYDTDGSEAGVQRTGYQNGNFIPDWVGTYHFVDDDDGHVNPCIGDSGGPAQLTSNNALAGVHHGAETADDKACRTEVGDKATWTLVSAKFSRPERAIVRAHALALPAWISCRRRY